MEKIFNTKFDKIELSSFFINHRPKSALSIVQAEVSFDVGVKNQVVYEKKLIIQIVNINVGLKKTKEPLSSITVLIGYTIDNYHDAVTFDETEKLYTINEELNVLLRNISLGTSRGILYTRLQGTFLEKAILPIIPNAMFEIGTVQQNK